MAENDDTAGLVLAGSKCIGCGGDIWVKPKIDGKPRKQQWCSKKCYQRERQKTRLYRYRPQSSRKWYDHVCIGCGKSFKSQRIDSKHCGRSCACKYSSGYRRPPYTQLPKYTKLHLVRCLGCGNKFLTKWSNKETCSTVCGSLVSARRKTARVAETKTCKVCGAVYSPLYGVKSKNYCSDECNSIDLLENERKHRRIARSRRRALIRETAVERIDPVDVFIRDNWTCQSCGDPTPDWLRGTIDDSAPEMDHIIPLARGGTHTDDNVQCLCRVCNLMKSDMLPSEFIEWSQSVGGA